MGNHAIDAIAVCSFLCTRHFDFFVTEDNDYTMTRLGGNIELKYNRPYF